MTQIVPSKWWTIQVVHIFGQNWDLPVMPSHLPPWAPGQMWRAGHARLHRGRLGGRHAAQVLGAEQGRQELQGGGLGRDGCWVTATVGQQQQMAEVKTRQITKHPNVGQYIIQMAKKHIEEFWDRLEAEGKGTKASEGKCGHVKRGVVGRVQSCLGTPSTLCLSSTFKRWQYSKAGNSIREIQDIVPKLNIQEVTVQQGRE